MKAMPTYLRPRVAVGTHPVETGRYVIATPPLVALYKDVKRWVSNRLYGCLIYGKQRFGKTWAIKYLVAQLPLDFGPTLPILSLNIRDYRSPTESTFFGDLLDEVGHAFSKGTASERRSRFREHLHEQAMRGKNRLIIILDEAQKLHEIQYRWLVDLHNELDKRGVTTTWLLVGQDELRSQREVFKRKQRQLIGRFMVQEHSFTGLTTVEHFRQCLLCYDDGTATDYPRGSGWSFTRYFFPAAFENGWRLAGQAETLWHTFSEVRTERRLPGTAEVPMQYFAGAVEYALKRFGNQQEVPAPLSTTMWKEAILSSGYHDMAQYF